ncbi:MAG: Rv2578c family radical SAM protein [Nocardioidaceae bacterium]|nr:Rv2578c family radical SAM protein [Nocardioidaceae bacterium]
MRWSSQRTDVEEDGALPGLTSATGLVRSVTTPEFAGVTFHEVRARSALNHVRQPPGGEGRLPFSWTVNPYRGCTHACVYCFARGTHSWLELDTGTGFDTEIVVKTNVAEVLGRELARRSWTHETVALGTNTDPYQRAEGRYRLMPGIIAALAASGTPMSILTKGTLLRRDLPLLVDASHRVPVSVGVSIAVGDHALHESVEPGTPSPRARLEMVRAVTDAGLPCHVMLAPVLPWLTDDTATLAALVERIAEAGATTVSAMALHLEPGVRDWFMRWVRLQRPDLLDRYEALYDRGPYAASWYTGRLASRVRPLLERHGLAGDGVRGPAPAAPPSRPVVLQPGLF